jgi:ribosomal 50S subunit-recycling heat shock protein
VRYDYYMNSNRVHEVRFTAKRACIWKGQRWITISRDKATAMIALGQAVELKEGEWF